MLGQGAELAFTGGLVSRVEEGLEGGSFGSELASGGWAFRQGTVGVASMPCVCIECLTRNL